MKNPIDEAIAALRRGDQVKAFTLLRQRLTQDPSDPLAWLWLSEATPDLRRKMEALERFVALAPEHPRTSSAQARLHNLRDRLAELPRETPGTAISFDEPPEQGRAPAPRAEVTVHAVPSPPVAPARPSEGSERRALHDSGPVSAAVPAPSSVRDPAPPGDLLTVAREPRARDARIQASEEHDDKSTAPHVYHPAVPALLQSLLDTAPMPAVRSDPTIGPERSHETAPRRAVGPEATPAERTRSVPFVESETDETVNDVPIGAPAARRTPWWAWAMLILMAVQIAQLTYILLRIEFLAAAAPR